MYKRQIVNGKITCVISSKPGVYALERAEKNGIPTVVIARSDYKDIADVYKRQEIT